MAAKKKQQRLDLAGGGAPGEINDFLGELFTLEDGIANLTEKIADLKAQVKQKRANVARLHLEIRNLVDQL